MPVQLTTFISFLVAVLAAGVAFYYWRRSANLYALLVEGANRYEDLRQRSVQLEQAAHSSEERHKSHREQVQRLNQAAEEARAKAAELARALEQKEHTVRLVSEKLELQKGHLERQLAKAEAQLQTQASELEAVQSKIAEFHTYETSLKAQVEAVRREAHRQAQAHAQEIALKERDWQNRAQELASAKASQESQAQVALELKRLKRKLAQYDRLYSSMKGLREMSEERNRNWEVALRKLATWIIETAGQGQVTPPDAIGPLVGQALQTVGAQLIDDQSSGAQKSDQMEELVAATLAGALVSKDSDHDDFATFSSGDDESPKIVR